MKTASIQDLQQGLAAILTWLQQGETIILLQNNGRPLGRIVPEGESQKSLFARRFAPLPSVPDRDLSAIVAENRGER